MIKYAMQTITQFHIASMLLGSASSHDIPWLYFGINKDHLILMDNTTNNGTTSGLNVLDAACQPTSSLLLGEVRMIVEFKKSISWPKHKNIIIFSFHKISPPYKREQFLKSTPPNRQINGPDLRPSGSALLLGLASAPRDSPWHGCSPLDGRKKNTKTLKTQGLKTV